MSSKHRSVFWGMEAVLAALTLASMLSPAKLFGLDGIKREGAETFLVRQRITAVQDSFDWADGIITALGELAPTLVPPLEPPLKLDRPRRKRGILSRRTNRLHLPRILEGRRLYLHKSTVFGIFDVTVDEIGPGFFSLRIDSTEPAENIQIRDRVNKAVLVDQPLDDERVFVVQVHQKLSPEIVISVSVLQDGEINRAYFPLLGGDIRN